MELSICADIHEPYRVGTQWDWSWFIPGELRFWNNLVRIIHPMDEDYPWHRWVGGDNLRNLKPGQIPGEKQPPKAVYTWAAFYHVTSQRYDGYMDLPRGSFKPVSWCGECGGQFIGSDYLCDPCRETEGYDRK